MQKPTLEVRFRLGLLIFVVLMVVEIIEFAIGVALDWGALAFLILLAGPGAGLIVYYFMHIEQLWSSEE